jgi:hypothetical protein
MFFPFSKEWGAWILKNDKKKLSVRINTPPTCYVGIWKFQVETIQKSDQKKIVFEYTHDQDIYILFNPKTLYWTQAALE